MTVFLVESCADYEGYSVLSAFDTEAQAVAHAEAWMKEFDDYTTNYKVSRWIGTTLEGEEGLLHVPLARGPTVNWTFYCLVCVDNRGRLTRVPFITREEAERAARGNPDALRIEEVLR